MSNVLKYDASTGDVLGYERSVDTSHWLGVANVLINPNLSATSSRDTGSWRVDLATKTVRQKTDTELQQRVDADKRLGRDRVSGDALPLELLAVINVLEQIKPGTKQAVKTEYIRLLKIEA